MLPVQRANMSGPSLVKEASLTVCFTKHRQEAGTVGPQDVSKLGVFQLSKG